MIKSQALRSSVRRFRESAASYAGYSELSSAYAVDTYTCNDCNSDMGKGARSQLARNLRLLRVLRGWTQEELAEASGLHRTYISLIERSACSVTLDKLECLADTFGIALPDLLSDTDSTEGGKRLLATYGRMGNKTESRTGRKKRSR